MALLYLETKQGCPPARVWQAVDPARAGKITGMLLDLEVHQIVPLNVLKIVALIVLPDMVRSTSPGSRLHSPTRPVAPCAAATEQRQRGARGAGLCTLRWRRPIRLTRPRRRRVS